MARRRKRPGRFELPSRSAHREPGARLTWRRRCRRFPSTMRPGAHDIIVNHHSMGCGCTYIALAHSCENSPNLHPPNPLYPAPGTCSSLPLRCPRKVTIADLTHPRLTPTWESRSRPWGSSQRRKSPFQGHSRSTRRCGAPA